MMSAVARGRPLAIDQQAGFRGGLNTVADESETGEMEVRRADNARLTVAGGIEKRLGSRYLHTTALGSGEPVRGGFAWQQTAATTELAIADGTLYTGTYAAPMTWAAQTGALDADAVPAFAAFRDASGECVYVADGGKLNKWDGTALTLDLSTSPAAIGWLCVYNQRLIGGSGADDHVYASGLNDGDSLGDPANGGIDAIVRTYGAQHITVGYPLGASLLLYHVAAISRFTGWTQDDIAIQSGAQGVTNDVGTIAPRSIVPLEDVHLFLTDRGVYAASEGGVSSVSNPIEETLAALDKSQWARVWALHNRRYREVLFYLPDVGIYAYNYRLQAWSGPWTGGYIAPVSACGWESRDAQARPLWLVGTDTGFVKRGDEPLSNADNLASDGTGGLAYLWAVRLRRQYHGDPSTEKSYRVAFPLFDARGSTAATLAWQSFAGTGVAPLTAAGSLWGNGVWGGTIWGAGSQTVRVLIHGRGNYIDFTVQDHGMSGRPLLSRLSAHAFVLGRRG